MAKAKKKKLKKKSNKKIAAKKIKKTTKPKKPAKNYKIKGFKKPEREVRWDRIIGVLLIIGIILLIVYMPKIREHMTHKGGTVDNSKIVAIVNGENITLNQLNKEYDFFFFVRGIPNAYKMRISKATILNQTIDEHLLIDEAEKEGFSVSQDEVTAVLNRAVNMSNISIENISALFEANNFSLDDLKKFYWKTLLINKLLNKTVEPQINVSDKDVKEFYNANNITGDYDSVKEGIKKQLLSQQRYALYLNYLDTLRKKADIKIFYNGTE